MSDLVRRRATERAFFEGRRIRVGEVVAVPPDFEASWLGKPLPEPKKSADEGKGKGKS